MKEFEIPECIVKALSKKNNLVDADFHLVGVGRAIAFVRMAASVLETFGHESLRIAEYHAYAGISASRTAIDATSSWLRLGSRFK